MTNSMSTTSGSTSFGSTSHTFRVSGVSSNNNNKNLSIYNKRMKEIMEDNKLTELERAGKMEMLRRKHGRN